MFQLTFLDLTDGPTHGSEGLLWFFLIGAFCPIIAWALTKRYPRSWIAYIKYVRPTYGFTIRTDV